MTLDSGDRVFFDVTPTHMTLQAVQFDNLEQDGGSLEYKGDCDTVTLYGRDVARFLDMLFGRQAGTVVEETADGSGLSIKRVGDTLFLETDANAVSLTNAERCMLHAAIASRVWRLFQ